MEEVNDLIGKQVGNYRIIEEIAAGSFGTVYRARHIYLNNRIVALKVLHMHMPPRERERFVQEAQFLESLHHHYILPVVDIGFDDGRLYLASTYAAGGSLRERLNKTHLLPWEQAQIILTQVGEALYYAHQQNIVHCDLKPENILFNAQGEAMLADFGIATVLSTLSVKQLGGVEGTPSYMAPEQFRGQVSKETDQYAFGCIAYELVTGRRLFSAPNFVAMGYLHATEQPTPPRQINAQIAVHVEQAILKALAKQRNDRHQDVAAFLTALQTPPPPQITKTEWLTKGNNLYDLKRYKEALEAYEEAIRLDPHFAMAYNNKGNALGDLKRYKEALEAYEEAIRLDPKYASAYNNKGLALRDLKRYKEAVEAYEEAIKLDPKYAMAYNNKGNALRDLKRYKEALEAYEEEIKLYPQGVYGYNNKGAALRDLKRYEEAVEAYEEAIRLDPKYANVYNGKGIALRNLKRYEEAVEAYEEAIRLDPKYAFAYNNKGFALDHLKRYEEALEAHEEAIRLDPKLANAYNGKGLVLQNLNQYREALEAYEEAIRLDPKYADAYNGKGIALYNLKRYEEALEAYEQAIRLDPKYANAYYNKANTLDRLGRTREAEQARKRARELGWGG